MQPIRYICRAGVSVALLAALSSHGAGWTNWHASAYPTENVWALPTNAVSTAPLWCRTNTICYTNWLSATQTVVIRTNVTYDCRIDRIPWDGNLPIARTVTVSGLTRWTTNGTSYLTNHVMVLSSTLTQLECRVQARDVWCIDTYYAWKERAAAADIEWWEPINNPIVDEPPLFIYTQNREHLVWMKSAIAQLATNFVNTNVLGALEQAALTNTVPMWTATGLVAKAGAPVSYFDATDWAMLNTASNGWRYIRPMLGMLSVTYNARANMEQDWEIQWHIAAGIATNYPIGICDAATMCSAVSNDSPLWMQSEVTWDYFQQYASHADPAWETLQWLKDLGIGVTNGALSFSETEWRDDVRYSHADEYEDGNMVVLSNYYPTAYTYQQRTLDEGHAGGYAAGAGAYPIDSTASTGFVWTADAAGQATWNSGYPNFLEAPRMYDLEHNTLVECYDQWTRGLDSGLQEWGICLTNAYSGGLYEEGEWFNFTIEPRTLWDWNTTNAFRWRN